MPFGFTVSRSGDTLRNPWLINFRGGEFQDFRDGSISLVDGTVLNYYADGTTDAPDGGAGASNAGADAEAADDGFTCNIKAE